MTTEPLLLYIETATEICSVALSEGHKLIGLKESSDGNSHSKNLLPFINEMLQDCHKELSQINGVVVSIGPGSYTGLRIGVSTAKGIAYSLNIPIIAINTLTGIAAGALEHYQEESIQIIPMIDARRMEVFTTRFDKNLNGLEQVSAVIVDENSFTDVLSDTKVLFCGNGMPKCKELLSKHPNAEFIDFPVSAKYMIAPALEKWEKQDFADTAYFEPFYLKEYVAGKPTVKGLH